LADTQWPRYQVFVQEKPGAPHIDAGSVHAPDAELALQNARDVFARRPECVSLWIAPAEKVFSWTREELDREVELESKQPMDEKTYLVFAKFSSSGYARYLGEVEARTPRGAVDLVQSRSQNENSPFLWLVVPAEAVTRSTEEDYAPMFEPAIRKPFRLSTDYPVITLMRAARKENKP
jgi:ring-1,2-phenylacetyl-CoA epoxidase subunit PaaB